MLLYLVDRLLSLFFSSTGVGEDPYSGKRRHQTPVVGNGY